MNESFTLDGWNNPFTTPRVSRPVRGMRTSGDAIPKPDAQAHHEPREGVLLPNLCSRLVVTSIRQEGSIHEHRSLRPEDLRDLSHAYGLDTLVPSADASRPPRRWLTVAGTTSLA